MTEYSHLLFDLDGTLTEPEEGITKSIQYALHKMGIEEKDRKSLCRFIGPPLIPAFCKEYGMSEQESRQALYYYRERFCTVGMFENEVYDGIPELLHDLKRAEKTLLVATTKPTPQAEEILKHFNLAQYFDGIAGSNLDETRTDKAEVIEYALSLAPPAERQAVCMIGDRMYDAAGAMKNGISFIGVLYGHGSEEELRGAGAKTLVPSVAALYDCLLK